jgi:hypothetical protein
MKKNKKSKLLALTCMLAMLFLAIGCDGGSGGGTTNPDPAGSGTYSKCTYTSGLSDSGYASAIVYYPCSGSGPFSATTLTGGYTNTKEDMAWLGNHLVTHGFVIIAMTPNNTLGTNSTWTTAHKAGVNKLISENSRSSSPIYGKVNANALGIMGFSKGGGGALLASSDVGTRVKATQALAPYMDFSYNLSGIRSATICYTGTSDSIASPSDVVSMYNSLPDSITRTLA